MNIALLHFRVGETDGVSLEMEKWQRVLTDMGHNVKLFSGSPASDLNVELPTLHYQYNRNLEIVKRAYENLGDWTPDDLAREIEDYADAVEEELRSALVEHEIEVVVPNNIWSLGWNLAAGLALSRIAQTGNLKFVAHHHDFYWERSRYAYPTCKYVEDLLANHFPPDIANVKHVTINQIAMQDLSNKRGIDSSVVPNVFDFDTSLWTADEYNKDFRALIGASEEDVVVLQATRITERKGIELGIDVAAALLQKIQESQGGLELYRDGKLSPNTRVWFVFAGLKECDDDYYDYLMRKGEESGLRMADVGSHVRSARTTKNGFKYYSLWDAYVHADLISYPSLLEGWGNQFLEALFARKPMVVYEYPVFITDIRDKGFHYVSLGSEHTSDAKGRARIEDEWVHGAAAECLQLLTDNTRYRDETEANFQLGKELYSLPSLSKMLQPLFAGSVTKTYAR